MTRLLLAVVTATLFMVGSMWALSALDRIDDGKEGVVVMARGPAPTCQEGLAR